jgi:putative copper export protein
VDWAAVAARALAFACLFQAAGVSFFLVLFAPGLPHSRSRIRRIGLLAALAAAALALLQPWLEAARMAGDFGGLLQPALLRLAWLSPPGAAQFLAAVGLGLVALGLRARRNAGSFVAAFGAVLATLTPLLTGHISVHAQRVVLAPILGVHVLIVAFWFGALWPLRLTLRYEAPADAGAVLRRFSVLAAWLVPGIALAGLIMASVLLGSWRGLLQPYGRILLAKAAVFVLLMALAAANRWRFVPALPAPAARRALQRSIRAEFLLLLGVLALTAVLTTLFSPDE